MADWVQDVGAEARERPDWRAWMVAAVARQSGTFFLWSPVCLLAGIWSYFALSREPPPAAFAVLALILVLLFLLAWLRRGTVATVLFLTLLGFSLAKIRTEWVASPVLRAPTGEVMLTGVVEDFEVRGPRRGAAVLRIVTLEGKGVTRLPSHARVTLSGGTRLLPGQVIKAKAQLFPLPPPAIPGGYDHGRTLWFQGIGATGRLYGDIASIGRDAAWLLRFKAAVQGLRDVIGLRIRAVIPPERSGVAEALITGERGSIPPEVNDSLQTSGLAHILSISGLHMTLVAGLFFALVRAVLALSPTLATAYPIKKWAAVAGLVMGFAYMVLAGASVATQRSYIMLAVMFVAILADRPALSMRNLAIAALIILVLFPEAALTASFQMSFLAVMGLLAFYEVWSKWLVEGETRRGLIGRLWRRAFRDFWAVAFTSLAAGGLSSIAAAYHFGRLAPYGLIANLLAFLAMSLVVMPMAVLAVLLMPFGLESWPLQAMDLGLVWVQAVSDWVSRLPAAQGMVPTLPRVTAILLGLAAIVLCLARGPVRGFALAFAIMSFIFIGLRDDPDIQIEGAAKTVAVRMAAGDMVPVHARRGRFAASLWLRREGDEVTPAEAARRPGWSCGEGVCGATVDGRRVVYVDRERPDMTLPCAEADILVAAFPLRGRCRSVKWRVDRFSVWREGAHALYFEADGIRVETARGLQGERPWVIMPEPRRKDTSRQ
ncbi:ComEC family competence protein [Nordella sp. HKS 07]|uniref:ComEC/Rec2 family competence protein n=1 Tax=Nordella sp. HKS 07 TaxID=2712222 RepID=UPI0013E1380E|nr:ComEC/Rec2 family competence protein [Nordella sp. HKS 07]QIG51220.1 ComEC family competence protein [Nordella sp. HKS 07]